MTTGRNNHVPLLFEKHTLIFILDDRRSNGSLLDVEKAELFKSAAHGFYANSFVVCNEGGSKANDYRVAGLDKNSHLLGAIRDLLGILRTLYDTVAAKDTLVAYNLRLIARKSDRLYRTLSDASEAGFAI